MWDASHIARDPRVLAQFSYMSLQSTQDKMPGQSFHSVETTCVNTVFMQCVRGLSLQTALKYLLWKRMRKLKKLSYK